MTEYQQEAERLKKLILQGNELQRQYLDECDLVAIMALIENQKSIIELLLARLNRYESAHQAFVSSIQGAGI